MPILLHESVINSDQDTLVHKPVAEDVDRDILATMPGLIYVENGTAENIAYSINEYFHKLNKKIVVLADYKEAPNAAYLLLQNEIVKLLYEVYGFKYEQLVYASGFLPTDENFIKLDKLFKENNLIPIQTINYVFFQREWSMISRAHPNVPAVKIKQNHRTRTRSFLYFTGAPRVQRWMLLGHLIQHKIIDKTHYSIFDDKNYILNHLNAAVKRTDDPRLLKHIQNAIFQIKNTPVEYPVKLTCDPQIHDHQHMINDGDVDLFLDTHISIIPETSFFKKEKLDHDLFWNFHGDFTFCTEKTFRAIAMLHPFIMMSRPFTLRSLRVLGYKTFEPYIDESYDAIIDDVERYEAISKVVLEMSKMTEKQWIQFERNIFPIVIHNKEVLKKSMHRPVWMHDVLDKYSDARNNHTFRG